MNPKIRRLFITIMRELNLGSKNTYFVPKVSRVGKFGKIMFTGASKRVDLSPTGKKNLKKLSVNWKSLNHKERGQLRKKLEAVLAEIKTNPKARQTYINELTA